MFSDIVLYRQFTHGHGQSGILSHHYSDEVLIMYLNNETKKILENSIGKSIHELSQMDADEEQDFVISKIGRVPIFSKKPDSRMRGRGNPLIARRRICTMDDINKRIMELK